MISAITGTIGSGKTTVAEILKQEGYIVISCDKINAQLLCETDYLNTLQQAFPQAVHINNGVLDKEIFKNYIFNNDEARKKLNSIAHPIICQRVLKEAAMHDGNVFVETPLLHESGMEWIFDKIWLVVADEELQIGRVAARDHISKEFAKKIYDLQESGEYTIPVTVIHNNGNIEELRQEILALL